MPVHTVSDSPSIRTETMNFAVTDLGETMQEVRPAGVAGSVAYSHMTHVGGRWHEYRVVYDTRHLHSLKQLVAALERVAAAEELQRAAEGECPLAAMRAAGL